MLLEFTDFIRDTEDEVYRLDISGGLIYVDEFSSGRWLASLYSADFPGWPVFSVEAEEPSFAANHLISRISDLQDDGDETALKMKITH